MSWKKQISLLLVGLCIGYMLVVLLMYTQQEFFIYYPSQQPFGDCPQLPGFEPKILSDFARGYYLAHEADTAKITVVYHGNAGSACHRSYMLPVLQQKNTSIFIAEYPGYSDHHLQPTKANFLQMVYDVIDFLDQQNYTQTQILGESLGTAVSAYHAKNADVKSLVLISPFPSLQDVARIHYSFLPVRLMQRNNFQTQQWLKNYEGSVQIIVAENDRIVPPSLSKKLYDNLNASHKEFHSISDTTHNTIWSSPEIEDIILAISKS
ncbi:MAG: alpha/beta hydrolase [Candidatus Woesearchaeota archaeon]